MSIFFFAVCILCIFYCGLYGAYNLADRHIAQAVSLFVMTAIALGAVAALMMVM